MLSRREAIATQAPHYYGKVCPKHRISKRRTNDCKCVECAKEQKRRYYKNNKDACLERSADHHDRNRDKMLQEMRKRYMKTRLEGVSIYALSLKSSPTDYFYCGQSTNPTVRRYQHKSEAKSVTGNLTAKQEFIKQALLDGDDIELTVLEVVPRNEWSDAENEWITKLSKDGHQLTNSITGTLLGVFDDDYVAPAPVPKTMTEFENIKWERGHALARKNEWYACAMGAELFRSGWSKIRVRTSTGEHLVHGYDKTSIGQKLVKTLTGGTPENKHMHAMNKQAKQLRGGIA